MRTALLIAVVLIAAGCGQVASPADAGQPISLDAGTATDAGTTVTEDAGLPTDSGVEFDKDAGIPWDGGGFGAGDADPRDAGPPPTAAQCLGLDAGACEQLRCTPVFGWRAKDHPTTTANSTREYAGCGPFSERGFLCQPAVSCSNEPSGVCWLFSNTCQPVDFERGGCSPERNCPSF